MNDELITLRRWLHEQLIKGGASWWLADEAVSSTLIEHPEWPADEQHTRAQWNDAATR